MIRDSLQEFIEHVIKCNCISDNDAIRLQSEVLDGGIASRIEAEALLALDRSLHATESWAVTLTRLVVDFVVWRQPRSGTVGSDDALWLSTALDVGGPTRSAMAIAYAILDEATHVDMALLDFIMRGRQQARLSSLAA